MDLGDLESRAALAEEKLKGLTSRVDTLQEVLSSDGPQQTIDQPLKDYQLHMLGQLRQLRKKMADEGEPSVLTVERDSLASENTALKKEVSKLNYRIKHLLTSLEAAEAPQSN